VRVERTNRPDDATRTGAQSLQKSALVVDGVEPFSEAVVLTWEDRAGQDDVAAGTHVLALTPSDRLAGYAHLDATGTAELAVEPGDRRQGYGRALVHALEQVAADRPEPSTLSIWSHGDLPAARALARSARYQPVRTLLQLRLAMTGRPVPEVHWPEGVSVRSFVPGQDDAAWLALNARAFAHHPEQGRMTQADLDARTAEPWFDPTGFLLAEKDGALAGFHWTKVHSDGPVPLGEVYVVGVDPDRHGGGLGTALTAAGLNLLYDRGLRTVLLYVEADNAPALAVYRRLGFGPYATDVMYQAARSPVR
jgi:mycothiol synthase